MAILYDLRKLEIPNPVVFRSTDTVIVEFQNYINVLMEV